MPIHINTIAIEEGKKKDDVIESVRVGKEQVDRKVANMVGTLLYEDSDGFQLPALKMEPEKVTNTVGTFLS